MRGRALNCRRNNEDPFSPCENAPRLRHEYLPRPLPSLKRLTYSWLRERERERGGKGRGDGERRQVNKTGTSYCKRKLLNLVIRFTFRGIKLSLLSRVQNLSRRRRGAENGTRDRGVRRTRSSRRQLGSRCAVSVDVELTLARVSSRDIRVFLADLAASREVCMIRTARLASV